MLSGAGSMECKATRGIRMSVKREEAGAFTPAFGGGNLCNIRQNPFAMQHIMRCLKEKNNFESFRRSPAIIQNMLAQPLSSLFDKIIIVRKCEVDVTENRNVYKNS